MRLKGKTALISGAGRNNGRAISLTFAREGPDLILVARKLGDQLNEQTPVGRSGTNQDVANVALFLASDESSYITGDYICCAGGRQM